MINRCPMKANETAKENPGRKSVRIGINILCSDINNLGQKNKILQKLLI